MASRNSKGRHAGSRRMLLVVVSILLAVVLIQPVRAVAPLPQILSLTAQTAILPYGLYSVLVDFYASRKVKAMQQVPCPLVESESAVESEEDDNDGACLLLTPIEELRKTISRASNLVENPRHRRQWNKWALHLLQQRQHQQTNTSNKYKSWTGENLLSGGATSYGFAYRSYVNDEEKIAICRALGSWHILTHPFVNRGKGRLTFESSDSDDDPDSSSNRRIKVTTVEQFWTRVFRPLTITWRGHVVVNRRPGYLESLFWSSSLSSSATRAPRIEWTSTEFIIGRGKGKQVIANPPVAETLRQLPWEILGITDGMLWLKRGTIGVLAYAKE